MVVCIAMNCYVLPFVVRKRLCCLWSCSVFSYKLNFACVAGECVNSAFIVFLWLVAWFRDSELLYRIRVSERNVYIRVFEEVGYPSYFGTPEDGQVTPETCRED
jgi:hypothetical protein